MKRGRVDRHHQQLADRLAVRCRLQIEDQREALVGDEREGVRGVDRLRGQHREDMVAEMVVEPRLARRVDLARRRARQAGAAQRRRAARPRPRCWLAVSAVRLGGDRGELLARG